MKKSLFASAILIALAAGAAHAEGGAAAGAAAGAVGGAVVGGPVGAVVGGVGGAIVGGIADADRPRFRTYVVERKYPSYKYDGDFRAGVILPEAGVTYYDVPEEYHVKKYRYTIVNGHAVLVDPATRRIVQIID
ncbi:MAG: DUF1236 domain-containing protein [Hyphomicrobiales bacterium]|nr:DUF1236 domain-containing protein [Hyphomicrobiales bacterium]